MIDFRAALLVLTMATPAAAEEYDCLIAPWRVVELGTAAAGIIEEIGIDRGDRIDEGQVIARMDSAIEQSTAALARQRANSTTSVELAQAQFEFESGNLDRARTLNERGVLPDQEISQAEAAFEISRLRVSEAREDKNAAELELKRAETILERLVLRSPLDGVVMDVQSSVGEYVAQTDTVATIAMIDPLRVEAFLPLEVLGRIQEGDEVAILPQEPVGGRFIATLDVIDEVIDARSGTIGVRLRLDNPRQLTLAGLNCRMELSLSD
jgi:RND family efflux transporter MFP subunit